MLWSARVHYYAHYVRRDDDAPWRLSIGASELRRRVESWDGSTELSFDDAHASMMLRAHKRDWQPASRTPRRGEVLRDQMRGSRLDILRFPERMSRNYF